MLLQTRRGSSVKCSKKTDSTCNLEYTARVKQVDIIRKRKMSNLDTNFLSGKRILDSSFENTSSHLKLDIWNWPKNTTRLNMRQNAMSIQLWVPQRHKGTSRKIFSIDCKEES